MLLKNTSWSSLPLRGTIFAPRIPFVFLFLSAPPSQFINQSHYDDHKYDHNHNRHNYYHHIWCYCNHNDDPNHDDQHNHHYNHHNHYDEYVDHHNQINLLVFTSSSAPSPFSNHYVDHHNHNHYDPYDIDDDEPKDYHNHHNC